MLSMTPDESAYINTAQTRSLTNIHSCATKLALHKAAQEYIKDLNMGRDVNFIRPAQKDESPAYLWTVSDEDTS